MYLDTVVEDMHNKLFIHRVFNFNFQFQFILFPSILYTRYGKRHMHNKQQYKYYCKYITDMCIINTDRKKERKKKKNKSFGY
jgi:hypothetical protein